LRSQSTFLFILSVIVVVALSAQTAHAEPWGPWSSSTDAPVLMMKADRATPAIVSPEPPSSSIAATPFLWLLSFYQRTVGPVVSGRCPMHPTCSRYSVEAIHKHGPVMGIVMTADRIIHELDEQQYAPLVRVGGRYRFADPVRGNDFWWFPE
jgi:hypothetical protein